MCLGVISFNSFNIDQYMEIEKVLFFSFVAAVVVLLNCAKPLRRSRIDSSGVLFMRPFKKDFYVAWEDVEKIGAVTVLTFSGGCVSGSALRVGIHLRDEHPSKAIKACRGNRILSGYDILVTPDWGMSIDEYSEQLSLYLKKYKVARSGGAGGGAGGGMSGMNRERK